MMTTKRRNNDSRNIPYVREKMEGQSIAMLRRDRETFSNPGGLAFNVRHYTRKNDRRKNDSCKKDRRKSGKSKERRQSVRSENTQNVGKPSTLELRTKASNGRAYYDTVWKRGKII